MNVSKNNIKQRLSHGNTVVGTWNFIPSTTVVDAIGISQLDFLVLDMEHAPTSLETLEDLVRTAEARSIAPIVRTSGLDPHEIRRALDTGAQGIHVPHITCRRDAEQLVEFARFHPLGDRGFSPFCRAGKYGGDERDFAANANSDTLVVAAVEGLSALEKLDDIASVDGIDVIFIGPYDMSNSVGKPGDVRAKEVVQAIRQGAEVAKKHQRICGSYAKDLDYIDILLECGIQYFTCLVDAAVIRSTYAHLRDVANEKIRNYRKL